jgi:hypothetical protein
MPDKESILSRLAGLPVKPLTLLTEDARYFWEGDEEGAHFKVTKDVFPPPMQLTTVSLSVSGEPSGKSKIIGDFRQVLGEELEAQTLELSGPTEFVLWDASSLTQHQT